MFTIVPQGNRLLKGEIKVLAQNISPIKKGQTVNLNLSNYSMSDFGKFKSIVTAINVNPELDNTYLIEVSLPELLSPMVKKNLDVTPYIRGDAEIITDDLRLMERFFYRFRTLL